MGFVSRFAAMLALILAIAPAAALTGQGQERLRAGGRSRLKGRCLLADLGHQKSAERAAILRHHHRGVGLPLQNKFDDAIVEFNAALQADPANVKSCNSRGNAWRGKGELDIAIADYNEAIRLDPGFAFPYNGRGSAYYDKGEFDRAISDYNEVIRLAPNLAAPYSNRALAWRSKGELDRALDDANEALRPR